METIDSIFYKDDGYINSWLMTNHIPNQNPITDRLVVTILIYNAQNMDLTNILSQNEGVYITHWRFQEYYQLSDAELVVKYKNLPKAYKKSPIPSGYKVPYRMGMVRDVMGLELKIYDLEYKLSVASFVKHVNKKNSRCNFSPIKSATENIQDNIFGENCFILEGAYRDINVLNKTDSEICTAIKEQLPSEQWMVESETIANSSSEIWSYLWMPDYNKVLRKNPSNPAPINDVINMIPPLDKDIIVYRYIRGNDDIFGNLNIGDIFRSYGYLSTTVFNCIMQNAYFQSFILMKIYVPKGKKGAFMSKAWGNQWEIIFPHNIQLKLLAKTEVNVIRYPIENLANPQDINSYKGKQYEFLML